MEINYIILAHKNPDQLKRLILRLSESWVNFYIHIDKNIDINPFLVELSEIPRVIFLKNNQRETGTWGDIGIVKGTINAIKEIGKENRIGYTILLSGQDYPLGSNDYIKTHLRNNYGTCFIELFEMPGGWKMHGLDRLRKYKINKSERRGHFLLLPTLFDRDFFSWKTAGQLNYLRKTWQLRNILKIFKKRSFPKYLRPFGGSQWWALPIPVLKRILDFLEEHPDYIEYHSNTLLPDEIFFHSIIAGFLDKEKIAPPITYANWKGSYGPFPTTFLVSDFDELKNAAKENLFARKFDIATDSNIFDLIDKKLTMKNDYQL